MPLISIARELIKIPVADRIVGDTRVKQLAQVIGFTHDHDPVTQLGVTVVKVLITCYAVDAETGGYGPQLQGPQFNTTYQLRLVADNDTLVHAQTGAIVARRDKSQVSLAPWFKLANEHPEPVAFQGDFFLAVRRGPVVVNDILTAHVLNADAPPSLFA